MGTSACNLQKYPVAELIIHPRLQRELYRFTPHKDAFSTAITALPAIPLCYNGDITSEKSYEELLRTVPATDCIMIGRGILRNPALAAQLKETDAARLFTKETIRAFHDEIFAGYAAQMAGETPTLFKMKDLWTYLIESFAASERFLKKYASHLTMPSTKSQSAICSASVRLRTDSI